MAGLARTPRMRGPGPAWSEGSFTVSGNHIASIDKLVVPSGTRRLDLRSNDLLDLGSPTKHHWPKRLEEIDLANNRLVVLRGLGSHEYLHTLDLSFNSLSSLHGLDSLPRLENLNMSHNNLSRIDELGGCGDPLSRSRSTRMVKNILSTNIIDDATSQPPEDQPQNVCSLAHSTRIQRRSCSAAQQDCTRSHHRCTRHGKALRIVL